MLHDSRCRKMLGLCRTLPFLPFVVACFALAAAASAEPIGDAPEGQLSVRRRPTSARAPLTYAETVRRWHLQPSATPSFTPDGRPMLVFEVLNTQEHVELTPQRDDGGFGAEDLALAAHALRDPRTDEECSVDPRLLDLAYRVERRFQAKALRVVSAFRTPRRRHSNHGKGRAIDLVVPGALDGEVARFARMIGFVGVGLYPRSGFVHLDSRPRSFFWIDRSGPGQRGRLRQVLPKLAELSDMKATERGDSPPGAEPGTDSENEDGEDTSEGRAR